MGSHPINLAFRLLLEIAAYVSMAYWGWTQHVGWQRYAWAIGLPLVWAILWGTFNVPDDPSRSGKAPVRVPGFVRLLLELAFFATSVWALYTAGGSMWGLIFAILVVVHYVLSYDRIAWLLKR